MKKLILFLVLIPTLLFNQNEISASKNLDLSKNYQIKKSLDITTLPEINLDKE